MRHPLILSILAAATLASAPARAGPGQRTLEPQPARLESLLQQAKAGDVIFFSSQGLWAGIGARWSQPRFRHGHVGMIVIHRAGLSVVHAKGSPIDADGGVRADSLGSFLASADRVSLFRPDSPAAADRAADAALGYADRHVPFDREFSLRTPEAVYCTELIWRALSAAYGEDLVSAKRIEYGRPIITLSDLERSSRLLLIGSVDRRAVVR